MWARWSNEIQWIKSYQDEKLFMAFTKLFREKEIGLFVQHKLGLGNDSEFWTTIQNDWFFDFLKFYQANKDIAIEWILEYESGYCIEMVKKVSFLY